jgi:hypothetical protein
MNYMWPLYSEMWGNHETGIGIAILAVFVLIVAAIIGAVVRVRYLKRHGRWGGRS